MFDVGASELHMPKLSHLRVFIDDVPQSGAWNMAVDEALLETAIERDLATLRLYCWREPTASLGYFQRAADFLAEPRFANLPAVRRLSGGGTLIHDQELTYSLTLPVSQRLIERPRELYALVHNAFINVFQRRGIGIRQRGSTVHRREEPLLCFAREDEHDLVLLGHKVVGSAQRRRRGAILQHGGLVLGASRVTPELPGIANLFPGAGLSGLEADLAFQVASSISEAFVVAGLSAEELARVAQLSLESYSSLSGPGRQST
jgi:lipoyl(octanoyl) transferase